MHSRIAMEVQNPFQIAWDKTPYATFADFILNKVQNYGSHPAIVSVMFPGSPLSKECFMPQARYPVRSVATLVARPIAMCWSASFLISGGRRREGRRQGRSLASYRPLLASSYAIFVKRLEWKINSQHSFLSSFLIAVYLMTNLVGRRYHSNGL